MPLTKRVYIKVRDHAIAQLLRAGLIPKNIRVVVGVGKSSVYRAIIRCKPAYPLSKRSSVTRRKIRIKVGKRVSAKNNHLG